MSNRAELGIKPGGRAPQRPARGLSRQAPGLVPALFLSCLLILTGIATGAQAATRGGARASAGSGAARVLVLPFNVRNEDGRQAADAEFAKRMNARLAASGASVVPHERMLALLRTRRAEALDPAAVRSLANAAGAAYAVYGAVNFSGSTLSLDARLTPAGAGRTPVPVFVELDGGPASLPAAADQLADAVLAELPRPGTPDTGGTVVAGIEVRGTLVLDPDVVLMRISTRKGDRPDAAAIDREVKQIWDLGYFSDVQVSLEPRPEGLWLVYTVKEKPKLESISFTGNSELDDDDLLAVMGSKAGSILNEKLLADDIQKILEAYRKDGYYLATVEQHVDVRSGTNSAALNLSINEGKKLYISEVRLDGCNRLDEDDVRDQLLLSARSIISWITGTGVLKEELIERDSTAVTAYYLDRGFLDVTVAAPKIDYTDDGIVITFPIHEGPQYALGDILLTGDLIDTEERLKQEIGLDEAASAGGWFNLTQMQNDVKKLTEFYSDFGYAYADIDASPRKRDGGAEVADVVFTISKKNKYYVRRVTAEGNIKTRDNVILREMRLTDGEQFQGDKLRRSTERLNKLGYFEVAEVELSPTGQEDEVDLKVKVKEKPTGALMAGVGYSTFSKVGVAATIMERNLWGKGYNISLQAAFSARRNAYTLSMGNPRWNDTDLSVGMDVYHWRDDYIDFTKRTTGGVLRFAYPLGEYTSIGWGYRLDQYEIYDTNDNAARLIRDYADGVRYTSVGLLRLVRDSTNRENPTSGNIDILGVEYGGGLLGGDDSFITLSAEHQTYYELWKDHVLHGRIKGMAILENGKDEVPVFERFWMGGMNTVRGYDSEDIVPRDPKTDDRIGGTRMAFMNLEYIYTLSNEAGLYLVPFYDMGFNVDADRSYKWDKEILKSAGLEMRWRSPMGDLRFSYGIPFDEDRSGHKSSGRFEFSMGQTF
ncbi:MAG: outer membrane protein assembly factor BamA [Desulfovibrio sp.]|jgi:outer membrane protein insertion porin family|nr:outer membrane protein assembly factor BamA [Desulfovibrio sp.]